MSIFDPNSNPYAVGIPHVPDTVKTDKGNFWIFLVGVAILFPFKEGCRMAELTPTEPVSQPNTVKPLPELPTETLPELPKRVKPLIGPQVKGKYRV